MDKSAVIYVVLEAVIFAIPLIGVIMRMGVYKERIDTLTKRIDKLDNIESRLTTIEVKQDSIEKSLDTVKTQMDTLLKHVIKEEED